MSKHMPGPWTYEEIRNAVTGIDNGGCRVLRATPYGGTPEEIEANGHLIAASQEMLEACQAMLFSFDEIRRKQDYASALGRFCHAKRLARAAIRKAGLDPDEH